MFKQLVVFSCVVCAALGAPQGPINVNTQLDKLIAEHNAAAAAFGPTSKRGFDFEGNGVKGEGVTLSDLSTLKRTGDALLWVDGDLYKFQMRIGFSTWKIDVDRFTFPHGDTRHVSFDVGDYSRLMEFTMKVTEDSCSIHWDNYVWEKSGHVVMHSEDPKYNGMDVTEIFEKIAMPLANERYKGEFFQNYLNTDHAYNFCRYAKHFFP